MSSQVERNDKLTTKICANCVFKINEFAAFRKICAATDIQLRETLSNGLRAESTVDAVDEALAAFDSDSGSFSVGGPTNPRLESFDAQM